MYKECKGEINLMNTLVPRFFLINIFYLKCITNQTQQGHNHPDIITLIDLFKCLKTDLDGCG